MKKTHSSLSRIPTALSGGVTEHSRSRRLISRNHFARTASAAAGAQPRNHIRTRNGNRIKLQSALSTHGGQYHNNRSSKRGLSCQMKPFEFDQDHNLLKMRPSASGLLGDFSGDIASLSSKNYNRYNVTSQGLKMIQSYGSQNLVTNHTSIIKDTIKMKN